MNCPSCGNSMDRGYTWIKGTLLSSFFYGLSRQHLWYGTDPRSYGEIFLRSNRSCEAYRCGQCDTLVIPGQRTEEGNIGFL